MSVEQGRFMRALRGERTDAPPVWMMRQAGRYLPEYRAVRERVDFVALCETPALAAEVTLQPITRLGVDAAILFSDILVPLKALGISFELEEGGPRVHPVVQSAEAVRRLALQDVAGTVPYVFEAVKQVVRALPDGVPLIGFSGAPFTLACYAIQGQGSRGFERARAFLMRESAAAERLLDLLTELVIRYLDAQLHAGAHAVQLFDTWAGLLAPDLFTRICLPIYQRIFAALAPRRAPRILFVGGLVPLETMAASGADALSLDWRVDLHNARATLPASLALQGNLDPVTLLTDPETIERETRTLVGNGGPTRHIVNLGHGILPETPVEHAQLFVDTVHDSSRRQP
jgi:uroporphyrinogen decarboxylase